MKNFGQNFNEPPEDLKIYIFSEDIFKMEIFYGNAWIEWIFLLIIFKGLSLPLASR